MRRLLGILAAFAVIALLPAVTLAQTSVDRSEHLYATLQTPLSTKTANAGDRFTMAVNEPFPNGTDLTGTTIAGHVSKVVRAGQGIKPELDLAFDRLTYPDGTSVPLSASLSTLQSKAQSKNALSVAVKTLGGLIAGNLIGRDLFKMGGGTAGALGAAGGLLYGVNEKTDLDVNPGAQAQLLLSEPLHARRQAL
jgi:hypothetical protein